MRKNNNLRKENNNVNVNNQPFANEREQQEWSRDVLLFALSEGRLPWRVDDAFAVTAFPFGDIPALVIVPFDKKRQQVGDLSETPPIVSYLPKQHSDETPEEAVAKFYRDEGFIGRLSNTAIYEEFSSSAWGMLPFQGKGNAA